MPRPVDPWLNTAHQDPHGTFWAAEICGPVASDEYGYQIDGILVTEHWYHLIGAGVAEPWLVHAVVRDELALRTGPPYHSLNGNVVVELLAMPEAIDVAIDVTMLCGANAGLRLVRRDDAPTGASHWALPPRIATRPIRVITWWAAIR